MLRNPLPVDKPGSWKSCTWVSIFTFVLWLSATFSTCLPFFMFLLWFWGLFSHTTFSLLCLKVDCYFVTHTHTPSFLWLHQWDSYCYNLAHWLPKCGISFPMKLDGEPLFNSWKANLSLTFVVVVVVWKLVRCGCVQFFCPELNYSAHNSSLLACGPAYSGSHQKIQQRGLLQILKWSVYYERDMVINAKWNGNLKHSSPDAFHSGLVWWDQ